MPNEWVCKVFRVTKHPLFFMFNSKKKPSITLGMVIKILIILKCVLTILHLLK